MELKTVRIDAPKDTNLILGQTHFIKSAEDIYEAIISTTPNARFGLAFCEASGPCLVRTEGNDEELTRAAAENARKIGCGHSFLVFLRNAYPINLLNALKNVQEVCGIYCATSNPVEVVVAGTEQGRGILGVIDGNSPKDIEGEEEVKERRGFLRKIGYKK